MGYNDAMDKIIIDSKVTSSQLSIHNRHDLESIVALGKALSSIDRCRIMAILSKQPMNLYELSVNLAIPFSSVYNHVNILSAAGLVMTNFKPTPKGHEKICTSAVECSIVDFRDNLTDDENVNTVEMPVGMYRDCKITPPCGMLSSKGRLGRMDEPAVFYSPHTDQAELLWFNNGYVSYFFPHARREKKISKISFSFEVCSETMLFKNDWKSDIFVEINGMECLTITSLGDFGGRRGNYTPDFWPLTSTQYGRLFTVSMDKKGVYLDGAKIANHKTIDDFHLNDEPFIKFTLGVKEDAVHMGGMNLFGKNFGDYNQAIIMNVSYETDKKKYV